jgi:uncharacterized damage-inducible protein DinB
LPLLEKDRIMTIIGDMLQELEQEAATTRRVLERVPDARLGWRPHPKARTLGELALHVAVVPGAVAQLAARPSPVEAPQFGADPSPAAAADLVPALDQSIADAKRTLQGMNDRTLTETWRLMQGDRELFAIPRAAFLRSVMLNHWYHHRGQLSTYLRQLDVAVPSIYGPSADENPFG